MSELKEPGNGPGSEQLAAEQGGPEFNPCKSVCQCMFVLSVLGRQRPEDGWGLLSSQSIYIGEPGTVRDPDLKTNIFNYINNINES